ATLNNAFTVVPAVTLNLAYNGKLRDRVGGGDTARTPDGALDGTLTLTLNATDGRTITALRLQNASGGVWDTTAPNAAWLLGVAAVTPNQGTSGSAVSVTIDGSGFVNGAAVSAGVGITVNGVVFVSSTRLTATFTIASDAGGGARDVTVTSPGGTGGTLANAFTVTTPET